MMVDEIRQATLNEIATWTSHDVANEEDAHAVQLTAISVRLSASTVRRLTKTVVDRDPDALAAALGDLRERNVQLAIGQPRPGRPDVASTYHADGPSRSAEVTLDEMKRRLRSGATVCLFDRDQDRVALCEHEERGPIDAREVDDVSTDASCS